MARPDLAKPRRWNRSLVLLTGGLLAAPVLSDLLVSESAAPELLIDFASLTALCAAGAIGWSLLRRTRRTDAALDRSEAQLRTLVNTALDGVIVADDAGRVLSMNRAAESIFGYESSEVVGRHFGLLLTQAGLEAHRAYLARRNAGLENHGPMLRQAEGRRKSGEAFPLELSLATWADGDRVIFAGIMRDVTKRRNTELALRRSEAVHRSVVDSAGEAVIAIDERATVTLFNPAAEAMFGYAAAEVVGRSLELLMPEPVAQAHSAYLARHGVTGLVLSGQQSTHKGRRRNGEIFPFAMNMTEWSDNGAPMFTGLIRDLTESQAAEAALRESEERYARVFAHSLEMITVFELRPDGEFVYNAINPAAERLTGMKSEALAGRTPGEVLPPQLAEGTLAALRRCLAVGEPIELESAFRKPDGSVASLTHQLVPIRDGDGPVTMLLAKSLDVTESRRAAAILQESQERFERLFEHSADALFVVTIGPGEEILYERVNRAAETLIGRSNEEISGRRLSDILPPEIAGPAAAGYLSCAKQAKVLLFEDQFEMDGQRRTFQASLVPIPDAKGRIARVLASSREITDRLIAEERVRSSQKLQAIGQLAGGVAHDFNNLLLVVEGYARRTLQLIGQEGEAASAAAEILKAAERGTELVKQLLVFSRRQINEPRPVRIADALKGTGGLLAPLLGVNHPVRFWIDEEAAGLSVEIDPAELVQAVLNLATNARDAMPGGGTVQIDLEIAEVDAASADQSGLQAGRYVEISVHDTGQGMEPATAARIFEPFFTTKEQGKGTGLGLAMVYGFAEQSGGSITAVSTPGAGSTFRLRLPISTREPVLDWAEMEADALGDGETVLLVEDDLQLLGLLRRTVEELGYRVIAAENGLEALQVEADHEGCIHAVLTDVTMPALGGFELADMLRLSRPETQVIFMSGYPARGELKAVTVPPGATFLQKPFTPAQLARALRRAVGEAPASVEAA